MTGTGQAGLGEAFDQMAAESPDEPAIIFQDEVTTRSQLAQWSNRLARRLAGTGVGFGSHVTIALPNGPGFDAAAIAIWKLGAVPQPVSYRLPAPELDALIEVADPAAVIGRAGLDPRGRPLVDPNEPLDAFDDGPLPPAVPPSWKAMTSGGSTGRPKLIATAVPGVADYVRLSGAGPRIDEGEVFLCTGPLYHNGPFLYSVAALYKGGRIVLMERFDAQGASSWSRRTASPTCTWSRR